MKCLKKIKFLCLLSLFLSLYGLFFAGSSVNAISLTSGDYLSIDNGVLVNGGGTVYSTKSQNDLVFSNLTFDNPIYSLAFDLSSPTGFTADTLISFNIRYQATGASTYTTNNTLITYDGLFSNTMDLVSTNCVDGELAETPAGGISSQKTRYLSCTYIFHSHGNYTRFSSIPDSRIVTFTSNQHWNKIIVTPGFVRHVNFNALTDDDRAWIQQNVGQAAVVSGIEDNTEAVNNPQYIQDEKEDLEEQKQETEDTAEDASSGAQATATSLLDVIVQAIGVFSNASPTSCVINGDLIPHLPLGNLNLCQNSPPPAITALGSILLIGFVVPLAYHLVKRMLALIGSFQT